MSFFIKQNFPYFNHFDKIKIYYDNGQSGVMGVISTVFTVLFNNAEIKIALQKDYKMLQAAGDEREINKTLKKLKMKEFKD